ncbi:hypothetical protein NMG60_11028359 [Bertholletia excelsa]
MSSLAQRDSETKNAFFYSRKEKSLGVLCSNFLKLYNRDGVDSIGLDDAANRLGVERRRIYDIVNILESVGVLSRKAKNQYFWKGFGAIPRALDELKEDALRENLSSSGCCYSANNPRKTTHGGPSSLKNDSQDKAPISSKVENRKEKSLGLLTQNFIKLFLCSDADLISLDNAATALLGDMHDPTAMRTKVRRLYDIANVFSSMNLIEKTHHPENRKPAFRWLGTKGKSKNQNATALEVNEPKKRIFGADITNTISKKYKPDWNSNQKIEMLMHMKHNSEHKHDMDSCEQQAGHSSKGFVFGPFAPAITPKIVGSESKNVRRVQDLEDLASYRPHYKNQALSELFDHYVAAWNSWFVEAAGKKQIQEAS